MSSDAQMTLRDEIPSGPFDGVWWQSDDGEVRVEIGGYVWDDTVPLAVWQGADELLLDVPLDAVDLRHLAAWATAVADAIENPPNGIPSGETRALRMPWSGYRAWKAKRGGSDG
jgi:hypothetical protein